ncbi:hypothetical protein PHYSODRAFT_255181 [Phytophthora sojae]|uniref:FYVE-type domain-containing protein n=1 Tax=Phytophthora sojae (strain P6497) TaxID=1094619 RepID=G4ZNL6_PHYSP|nr:hypothetical protein PHYSODRAFT_333037 [Phytophthora sojae]XP_009528494.1 hypothetical protein PHYSODRAFT_255181 [Phytophthora sojae]EGZ14695.1 hypothetical protein PHYSODRAFT_333037 [Phytophthora sojae]EGZ14745.1 hypothetical protein PHYSODRAFT_255181 [Phytophthora sojae]|eukprot:XP_009528444.1 hypothetical protein PHYSODRAFT_333037 [Phytophthora sojae]
MKSRLVDLLPELSVSDADRVMLRDLASTLVAHNLEQCNTLLVTKNGYPDSATGQWKEMRRKDGLRIYRERPGSGRGEAPFTPSLLLFGTVDGTVEDVMYGVVAPTDAALKIKSRCVNDGMLDTKMLCQLEEASVEDPFHHVGIKWKLYHGRDYISLDATGVVHSSKGERVGYNFAHSVAFSELPQFKSQGVLRGNMSVCSLYKQKTPTTVECYVRGFFDFPTKNEMLNNVSLQALASQWLSFGRKVECARMKKLVWKLRRNSLDGRSSDASSSSSSTCSSSSFGLPPNAKASPSSSIRPGACTLCLNSFGFLGTSRETCQSCMQLMCTRCTVKKIVYVMASDGRTVLEKKRPFCGGCVEDILGSDTVAIAREELAFDQDNGGSEFERMSELNLRKAGRGLPIPERAKSY